MKKYTFVILLSCLWLNGYASECSNIEYLTHKSQGVEVFNDSCNKDNEVGLGTVFKLSRGARLWMSSKSKSQTDPEFQVVCQSGSTTPVQVTVSSTFLPWITPNELNNCSGWIANKLKCDGIEGNVNIFVCALAAIKRSDALALALTTSVKMRRLSEQEEQLNFEQIVDTMKPEVELCRSLFQVDDKVIVNWTIDTSGQASGISLSSDNRNSPEFSECVTTVIKSYRYPLLKSEKTISQTF